MHAAIDTRKKPTRQNEMTVKQQLPMMVSILFLYSISPAFINGLLTSQNFQTNLFQIFLHDICLIDRFRTLYFFFLLSLCFLNWIHLRFHSPNEIQTFRSKCATANTKPCLEVYAMPTVSYFHNVCLKPRGTNGLIFWK